MNEMSDGLPQIEQSQMQGNAQASDNLPDQTQVQDDAQVPDLPQETVDETLTESPQDNGQPVPSYQFFPNLLHEEEHALMKSILQFGIINPITRDEDGNIIEGYQRHRLSDEEGVYCPEVVRKFGSEQEKYQFALVANCARRHLTTTQKRDVVAAYLKRDPEISNNWLGEIIGISANTVLAEREKLESTSQIARLPKLRGKDGKKRTAKPHRKKVEQTQKQDALPAEDILGTDAQEEPQVIPFTSEDAAVETLNKELTVEEYEAVIDFVTAVGGWTRAKLVFEEGEKQWNQNQNG